jgi:hypothetical protein
MIVMNPPGWRRHASATQASPEILEILRGLAVSLLSDNMARVSGTIGLVPYHRPKPMAGTAVTVRTRPGDNLAIHRAFDFCRPGDVLVIDGGGDITQALMGEIMATYAESLGVKGWAPFEDTTSRSMRVPRRIVALIRTVLARSMWRSPSVAWWCSPATSS